MLMLFAFGFAILASSGVHGEVFLNNTDCSWDANVCVPTALCESTGATCQVKVGVDFYPQQLHLAYAGTSPGTAMTVSWATYAEMNDSSYFYKVGSKTNPKYTSDVYSFITARAATDNSTFNMVIYGDFGAGNESKDTLAYVNTLNVDNVDLIYHLGDIGYADDAWLMPDQVDGFFYEKVYNDWMNSMASVMSSVPYMVLVGNHEYECHSPACAASAERMNALRNFTAYNSRFRMPSKEVGGTLNMWYSFEHGPIHFTSVSSETDYKVGHNANIQAAFEDLLIKYKVDIVLTGHQHYYERQTPIRNSTAVLDGVSSDFKTYTNPQAPVYILSGACGTVEGLDPVPDTNNVTWNAFSNYVDYGFSTLEANRSMLSWKFLNSSNQAVLDEFIMWKTPSSADN
eukprot:jgi/Phyca11/14569/fgenesh1_pg.PHYCAscaffold_8_\